MSLKSDIVQQIIFIGKVPAPFLIMSVILAGIIWRLLKWRYEGIIEGLEHRVKLRDDTINRYEAGGVPPSGSAAVKVVRSNLTHASQSNVKTCSNDTMDIFAPRGRHFVAPSVKPEDLRQIYRVSTSIQADRQAIIYLGKWMEVEGKVHSVYGHTQNRVRLRLLDRDSDAIGLCGLWLTFCGDRDILETLKIGDSVTAIGKLDSLSEFDLNLEECELIKAK